MDLERLLGTAREAAKLAGDHLLELWQVPRDIHIKADASLVTQIDTENEALLIDYFKKATPDFGFLGEESGIHEAQKSGEPYWYVDPVDGTTNMAHRFPWACISIGLVIAGEPVVGVVNNPVQRHEFYGAKGCGSYFNGLKMHVSSGTPFERSLLATGFPVGPHQHEHIANMKNFDRVSHHVHSVRRPGSAALDLAAVAVGWLDGFWEIGLKPWDTAAGVVLVREAGGIVSGFEGDGYDPHDHYILAANPEIYKDLDVLLTKAG
ncbi:MAG: inositol monophosphatase [Proteobacteria bacterium]|nr:inositol monophosphatase [Pseudomonadota bacterium]